MNDLNETLKERGNNYGDFDRGAIIMQQLKRVMRTHTSDRFEPYQKEALEMIAHKMGRILNGDPNYTDSWQDIAGYAMLVVKELEKRVAE